MYAWVSMHSAAIAAASALLVALTAKYDAHRANARAGGLELAVEHLAARLGISLDDLNEAHWLEHPDCRPAGE